MFFWKKAFFFSVWKKMCFLKNFFPKKFKKISEIFYGPKTFWNFKKKEKCFFQKIKVLVYRGKKFFFLQKKLFLSKTKCPLSFPFSKMGGGGVFCHRFNHLTNSGIVEHFLTFFFHTWFQTYRWRVFSGEPFTKTLRFLLISIFHNQQLRFWETFHAINNSIIFHQIFVFFFFNFFYQFIKIK